MAKFISWIELFKWLKLFHISIQFAWWARIYSYLAEVLQDFLRFIPNLYIRFQISTHSKYLRPLNIVAQINKMSAYLEIRKKKFIKIIISKSFMGKSSKEKILDKQSAIELAKEINTNLQTHRNFSILPFPRTFFHFFSIIPHFLQDFSFSSHPTLLLQHFLLVLNFSRLLFFCCKTNRQIRSSYNCTALCKVKQMNGVKNSIEKCVYCFWK